MTQLLAKTALADSAPCGQQGAGSEDRRQSGAAQPKAPLANAKEIA